MLGPVQLAGQWRELETGLPATWGEARLVLTVSDERDAERAAALLGPVNPARRGRELRLHLSRRGGGPSPTAIGRLLARLDAERIEGTLELVSSAEQVAPAPAPQPLTLAEAWDSSLAALPSDWSDVYAEVALTSTDHLDRAALLLAPANPARYGDKPGFRFRCARRFGYGVSPQMARRCLARLDEERIRGAVRVLRVLSDTRPVGTQGPVWYVGGKVV
jgi:hypothetical protein